MVLLGIDRGISFVVKYDLYAFGSCYAADGVVRHKDGSVVVGRIRLVFPWFGKKVKIVLDDGFEKSN